MTTAAASRRRYLPRDEAEAGPGRVALYLRMSQDTGDRRGEAEGLGIARQEAACRAEADRRGWSVGEADVYRDNDVSASSGKVRPGYAALMRRVERGEIDTVFSRSFRRCCRLNSQSDRAAEVTVADTRQH